MKTSFFKKTDILILFFVLLLSFAIMLPFLTKEPAQTATVRRYGEVIDTVTLSEREERIYTFEEGDVRVLFSKKGVSVLSSPCAGKDCVHRGEVSEEGGGIFCLPLGFSVTLSGERAEDAVTG